MAELLEQHPERRPVSPLREGDERAARATLLDQIARLEGELGAVFCSAFPRQGLDFGVAGRGGGPRLLDLGELEEIRDALAERVAHVRRALCDRTYVEELNRRRLERMWLEPEKHRWERISNEDIGERGCTSYEVKPRLGPVGMMMGWWRVVVSGGCPLSTASAARHRV